VVKATFDALLSLKDEQDVLRLRGLTERADALAAAANAPAKKPGAAAAPAAAENTGA
jgi:hypothetical protein